MRAYLRRAEKYSLAQHWIKIMLNLRYVAIEFDKIALDKM